jgi:hypothetical protein
MQPINVQAGLLTRLYADSVFNKSKGSGINRNGQLPIGWMRQIRRIPFIRRIRMLRPIRG